MPPRIRCLLTFDYEVFHGSNLLPYEDVLFRPTEEIITLCDKLDVKTTFFPDVYSAWWHRENGMADFADRFEDQLRLLVRRGHDVQLHAHPHWLFATLEDGTWRIPPDKVYLHELGWGPGEDEAPAVLRRGVAYLEELLRVVEPDYRCNSFRAAALMLQPDERELLQALLSAGLVLDSSVIKGVRSETDTYVLDYRDAPQQANWWMAPETGLEPASKGVFEVPVGTFRTSLPQRLGFLLRRARSAGLRRGRPMSRAERQTRLGSLWHLALMNLRYLANPWLTLSCDTKGFDLAMVADGLDDYVRRHPGDDEIVVAVIDHPKLMFEPQMDLLRRFVEEGRRRYGDAIDFPTCADIVRERLQ